jgi:predicted O-linked N-acetylglucosamine transferase (SPINDLY family)
VHIAIDLKGLTAGNRLGVFARRCAPIQVAYLGHPGTTGADFMDYLIADRVVVPEQDRRWYTEKVVYLPDSYQVNDTRREVAMLAPARAQVGLPEESFVYCCFNACYKITLALFAVWMKLLKRVPRSVLWLLDDNQAATRNLRNEAERAGVASERLVFAPRALPADHLARYRLADLFVDTLPVGAHTTASEALWAGLPVLTCAGDAFPGRVGASLLRAAGLPELIAENMTQYEALALDLAAAPERLRALRERLTLRRDTCALFDINRFCGHLESAYRSMWQNYQSGEPATGFAVTPLGPGLGDDP